MRYKEYLDDVCRCINFRAAHRILRKELSAHIDDKVNELKEAGVDNAEAKAIDAMGDPHETGLALNSIHKPQTEWSMIAIILFLSIVGMIAYILITLDNEPYINNIGVIDRLPSVIVGFAAMIGVTFVNYNIIKRMRIVLFVGAIAMNILFIVAMHEQVTYFTTIHTFTHTASVFLYIISISGFIAAAKERGIKGFILISVLCAISLFATVTSLNNVILLSVVYLSMVLIAIYQYDFSVKHLLTYALTAVGAIFIITLLVYILNPEYIHLLPMSFDSPIDIPGVDFCTMQAREMLEGAKLIGSSDKYLLFGADYLFRSHTNYFLTAIVAKFGWLFAGALISLFTAMFAVMLSKSLKIKHTFGKILSIGISSYFAVRFLLSVLINFGVFGGLDSATPFVSFGRFDYMFNALLVGIFLSVWRRSSFMCKDTDDEPKLLKKNYAKV